MDSPEGSNMEAPRDLISLWSLSSLPFLKLFFPQKNWLNFQHQKGETTMATKNSMWVLFDILVISALILGSAIQVGAETMKFKSYSYVTKSESIPVGDVEGHTLSVIIRRSFVLFDNGEVATGRAVVSTDMIKGSGSSIQYRTLTFTDGSTIVERGVGKQGGTASAAESEIIKGTGRFEGIKGTSTSKSKILPAEKDEAGVKLVSEVTMTYTLPSK
jgi:hypothetical protein